MYRFLRCGLVFSGFYGLLSGCGTTADPCASIETVEAATASLNKIAVALGPEDTVPSRKPATVNLYIDRSGSMAGYLDRDFATGFGVTPGSSSLRSVLTLLSSVPNLRAFGFGNALAPVQSATNQDVIAQLVRQEFYSDSDTRLEDVLDAVEADTQKAAVHIIITDGRRGDGASAIAQYQRLGRIAHEWSNSSSGGSSFGVAAVEAPFQQARSDKAGCWTTRSQTLFRCPLYAFAFIPGGSAFDVLPRLQAAMPHLHVTPTPVDASAKEQPQPFVSVSGKTDERHYPEQGENPLRLLVHSTAAPSVNSVVRTQVDFDLRSSLAQFALSDSLDTRVRSAPLCGGQKASWQEGGEHANRLKLGPIRVDSTRALVELPVEVRTHSEIQNGRAYQVELISTGTPRWVAMFNAPQQGDSTRTYGLSALFSQLNAKQVRLGGFYVALY